MDGRANLEDSLSGSELLAHRRFVHALARHLVRNPETAFTIGTDEGPAVRIDLR